MVMLLFASGLLLGLGNYFGIGRDELIPVYVGALAVLMIPAMLIYRSMSETSKREEKVAELVAQAKAIANVKREAKQKIPKQNPRRESPAAFEGSTKLGAVRSMAALVRKPLLREKILEICDFGDLVLETIRRTPQDTPAAVTFCEQHLSKLSDALERFFEMYKSEEYRNASSSTDVHEVECFSTFITAFRKQQDCILLESGISEPKQRQPRPQNIV